MLVLEGFDLGSFRCASKVETTEPPRYCNLSAQRRRKAQAQARNSPTDAQLTFSFQQNGTLLGQLPRCNRISDFTMTEIRMDRSAASGYRA
jgi:hypothetical protein